METSAGNPRTLNSVAGNLQHFLIILFIQVSSQCLLFLQTHQLSQSHDATALYKKTANGYIPLEIPHCHKGTVPPATCSFICSVCYNQNILPTDHLDYNIKQISKSTMVAWIKIAPIGSYGTAWLKLRLYWSRRDLVRGNLTLGGGLWGFRSPSQASWLTLTSCFLRM